MIRFTVGFPHSRLELEHHNQYTSLGNEVLKLAYAKPNTRCHGLQSRSLTTTTVAYNTHRIHKQ